MKLIVLFDLPVKTKANRKAYTNFRDFLLDDGFVMIQYSVYYRFCKNQQDSIKHTSRIIDNSPKEGNVRILSVTEKQFENMILVIGDKSDNENINMDNYTIVL